MSRKLLASVSAAALLAVGYATPSFSQAATPIKPGSVQITEELMLKDGKLVAKRHYRTVQKKSRWKIKPTTTASPTPTATTTTTTTTTTSPSPTSTASSTPSDWQPSVAPSGDASHYSFIATGPDGKPVRWNPCAMPITWRFNGTYGPSNAYDLTVEALNRVSSATGFTFKYLGTTSVIPYAATNNTNPSDTNLVVAWATPTQVSNLSGSVVGVGGPAYSWNSSGSAKITSGQMVIDSTDVAPTGFLKSGFQQGASVGNVLLHEAGHAMGLGHYSESFEVMNSGVSSSSNAWYMNGDLGGLSFINSKQSCFTW